MKQFDTYLNPPQLSNPNDQREMASFCARVQEILQFISDNLGTIKVVETAPATGELSTIGDGKGNVLSEVVILNNSTQSNRKLYYKDSAGNLRLIDSA